MKDAVVIYVTVGEAKSFGGKKNQMGRLALATLGAALVACLVFSAAEEVSIVCVLSLRNREILNSRTEFLSLDTLKRRTANMRPILLQLMPNAWCSSTTYSRSSRSLSCSLPRKRYAAGYCKKKDGAF